MISTHKNLMKSQLVISLRSKQIKVLENLMISKKHIIKSPISSGYINECLKAREKRLGKRLYQIWKFLYPLFTYEKPERHYGFYVRGIEKQVKYRTSPTVEDWPSQKHYDIAKIIEKHIADKCWGTLLQFYPDDSFYIIGEFEVGDGSEQELLMQIEEDFGFLFSENLDEQISKDTSFLEVVEYVLDNI